MSTDLTAEVNLSISKHIKNPIKRPYKYLMGFYYVTKPIALRFIMLIIDSAIPLKTMIFLTKN